jgi:hypothetical protein
VDGSQHLKDVKYDEQRTAWLQSRGHRVLRFWDNDVLQRQDGVLESIRIALEEAPTLPSPKGQGNLCRSRRSPRSQPPSWHVAGIDSGKPL